MSLKNKKINIGVIKKVAEALGELNKKVVYVGGAVVSIYADDPAADDVRPTKDVDIFLEIASYGKLSEFQEELASKGFHPTPEQNIMCRFKYDDILLDVMSTKEVGWASADKWFKPGLKKLEQFQIENVKINVLHVSYFLATKFNAFRDRKEDARTSRHFEDIVYLLDNRENLVEEIINSPDDVRNYLIKEFKEIIKPEYKEAFLGHLYYETQIERYELIKEKLIGIVNGV
ncbi:MAG: nucleotidyl transferase AbiEii/AbiGii toxin family protein [Ignavibacteriaceae bacterium]